MKTRLLAASCAFAMLGFGVARADTRAGQGPRLLRAPAVPRALESSALLGRLSRASDYAVLGRVVTVVASPTGPRGEPGIHTQVELEVERSLIGPARNHVRFWVHGGEWQNHARRVSGQARFAVDETVAVFLRARPDGELFPTEMGLGKWQADLEAGVIRRSGEVHALPEFEALVRGTR